MLRVLPPAAQWLGDRGAAWDDEQIGRLAHPPPTLAQLTAQLQQHYGWLRDPSPEEARWAAADRRDRGSILQALRTLPASTLADAPLR